MLLLLVVAAQVVATATSVEVAAGSAHAAGAGFQPPQQRQLSASGEVQLGPFAVAVVQVAPSPRLKTTDRSAALAGLRDVDAIPTPAEHTGVAPPPACQKTPAALM